MLTQQHANLSEVRPYRGAPAPGDQSIEAFLPQMRGKDGKPLPHTGIPGWFLTQQRLVRSTAHAEVRQRRVTSLLWRSCSA